MSLVEKEKMRAFLYFGVCIYNMYDARRCTVPKRVIFWLKTPSLFLVISSKKPTSPVGVITSDVFKDFHGNQSCHSIAEDMFAWQETNLLVWRLTNMFSWTTLIFWFRVVKSYTTWHFVWSGWIRFLFNMIYCIAFFFLHNTYILGSVKSWITGYYAG